MICEALCLPTVLGNCVCDVSFCAVCSWYHCPLWPEGALVSQILLTFITNSTIYPKQIGTNCTCAH